jgi:hypothetical protein
MSKIIKSLKNDTKKLKESQGCPDTAAVDKSNRNLLLLIRNIVTFYQKKRNKTKMIGTQRQQKKIVSGDPEKILNKKIGNNNI